MLHFLHRCYTFCTGVTLELHCSQPIRIEYFFHVYYYASNNRKRDNVKIIRIALDLHDVIVDSKKVVLFV